MTEIKLHNGKPARTASLKEINAAIEWFSEKNLDFKNGSKLTCLKAKNKEKLRGLTTNLPTVDF
jgi:hypothetical protein